MIKQYGDLMEVIRPTFDPETRTWVISLDYLCLIPVYAAGTGGLIHLPGNGDMVQHQVIHREHVKTREELILE